MDDDIYPKLSVKEIMNDLLESTIIPHRDLIALKNDKALLDPNLVMELRHNEIKERWRINNKEETTVESRNKYLNNKAKENNQINNLTETIIVDKEIKKYQKLYETENRKMNQLILNIKQSGSEIKNKSKKLQSKNEKIEQKKSYKEIKTLSINVGETLSDNPCNEINETVHKTLFPENCQNEITLNQEERTINYEKDLCELSKIKKFLDSIDNFEEINQEQDNVADNLSSNLDSIFEEMETLNKLHKSVCNETASSSNIMKIDSRKQAESYNLKKKYKNSKPEKQLNITHKNVIGELDEESRGLVRGNGAFINNDKLQKHSINDSNMPLEMVRKKYNAAEFTVVGDKTDKSEVICLINLSDSLNKIIKNNDDEDVVTEHDEYNINYTKGIKKASESNLYNKREKYLTTKFFIKWKNNTALNINKKSQKYSTDLKVRNAVESKFDIFISKLQKCIKEKDVKETENLKKIQVNEPKLKSTNYGEKFKNRFKAQKDIIEKQRQILEEQSRTIKKLEQSEINHKHDRADKKKNKIIKNNNKETKFNDEIIDKPNSNNNVPKFLENMNKRAEERKEKRQKLNELKLKKEEEKIKLKLQEEEEQKRKEEEKKYAAIKTEQMEYLQKILQEEKRKTEIRNQQEGERRLTLLNKGLLLPHYFSLWMKSMKKNKENIKKIHVIFEINLKRKILEYLKYYTERQKRKKIKLAQTFRKYKLQKKYWTIWHMKLIEQKQINQVAEDYNDLRLSQRALTGLIWNRWQNKRTEDELMLQAVSYHSKKLLSKGFQSLRLYPRIAYEEREKEKRLRSWEEKVKEILPDFSIT